MLQLWMTAGQMTIALITNLCPRAPVFRSVPLFEIQSHMSMAQKVLNDIQMLMPVIEMVIPYTCARTTDLKTSVQSA